jgi:hypothetical protein
MKLTQYEAIALLVQNPQPQRIKGVTEEVLLSGLVNFTCTPQQGLGSMRLILKEVFKG